MDKNTIQEKCKSINLSCSFKTGGYTESTKAGIAVSQSKKSGTKSKRTRSSRKIP